MPNEATVVEGWKILKWMGKLTQMGKPFKRQPHRTVKHIQKIRRQFADELFECLTILRSWRLKG